MHWSTARRVVSLVLVLFALAPPLTAQPAEEPRASLGRLVSALWERLSSPLVSLGEKGRLHIDPDGSTTPPPTDPAPASEPDGRIHIDPDG